MGTRTRKAVIRPAFKLGKPAPEAEGEDLKKEKAKILKELEEDQANKKEWYDKELEKNLKNQK